jgi:hypothetical protein
VEIFNLKKLNELEFRIQYQIKISKRFAALENLNDRWGLGKHSENVETLATESLDLYEFKQQKRWLDEKCSLF